MFDGTVTADIYVLKHLIIDKGGAAYHVFCCCRYIRTAVFNIPREVLCHTEDVLLESHNSRHREGWGGVYSAYIRTAAADSSRQQ